MKIYVVGGAIRDKLLGLPIKDYDYVVVGSTPQQMISYGFRPVGKNFPVFLHPDSQEEYALARTERKIHVGYHGFNCYYTPNITLKEDLMRRDLTINAMAQEIDSTGKLKGPIIDPYGGQKDLMLHKFRHVSLAFAEDAVRILRLARFAAKFPMFDIVDETMNLIYKMISSGEINTLVPERIWQEISRGLMENKPSRMFHILITCGALPHILPLLFNKFKKYSSTHKMYALDYAAKCNYKLPVRFAILTYNFNKFYKQKLTKLSTHNSLEKNHCFKCFLKQLNLSLPKECINLAYILTNEFTNIHKSLNFSADEIVLLLERCDAIRQPLRFTQLVQACEANAFGYFGIKNVLPYYKQSKLLNHILQTIRNINYSKMNNLFSSKHEENSYEFSQKIKLEINKIRTLAAQLALKSYPFFYK